MKKNYIVLLRVMVTACNYISLALTVCKYGRTMVFPPIDGFFTINTLEYFN